MRKRVLRAVIGVLLLLSLGVGIPVVAASVMTRPQPGLNSPSECSNCDTGSGEGACEGTRDGCAANDEGLLEEPVLSGAEETLDTGHFRVHYTLSGKDAVSGNDDNGNGRPDYVEEVAGTLEHVREVEVNNFGWVAPPPDGDRGGNGLYDVYLVDLLSEGIGGFVDGGSPDTIVGDNPNSPGVVETRAAVSLMALDNDYVDPEEADGDPLEDMRVTAAHEYLHAIQHGYDGREPADWIWEATATWMQDEVYDDINADSETIATVVESPSTCQPGADPYGMWVLFRHISERYGRDTVRSVWEQARTRDGYEAIEAALSQAGTTLEDTMSDFALALLTRDFEEGADYPVVRLEGTAKGREFAPENGVGQMGMDFVAVEANGIVNVALDEKGLKGILVGVGGGRAGVYDMTDGSATVDTDRFDHLYVVVVNTDRAETPDACKETGYKITITPGGKGDEPSRVVEASNFTTPEEGEVAAGEFDDGWGEDCEDCEDCDFVDWFAVAAEAIGVDQDALSADLDKGKSIAEVARDRGVDEQKVIDAIVTAEKSSIDDMVSAGEMDSEEADEWRSILDEEARSFVEESWEGVELDGDVGEGDSDEGYINEGYFREAI